jgi:hypothetical protein
MAITNHERVGKALELLTGFLKCLGHWKQLDKVR